jgi:hypothetical protein
MTKELEYHVQLFQKSFVVVSPQTFITTNANRLQMGHTISKLHPTCNCI